LHDGTSPPEVRTRRQYLRAIAVGPFTTTGTTVATGTMTAATMRRSAGSRGSTHRHNLAPDPTGSYALDRGTTSGLLVHDQNDVGILGSLPSHVDRALLASWARHVSPPHDALVHALVDAIPAPPDGTRSPIEATTKQALAAVVRQFYRDHPEAIANQASGTVIPPTVGNHR
jgi:hypothetical protein